MISELLYSAPDPLSIILGGFGVIAGGVCCALSIPPMRRTATFEEPIEEAGQLPSVSVVIYAHNAAGTLEELISNLSRQDYPDYEIIVVNDGSTDETADILDRLAEEYPLLRHTFTPEGCINLSRRKLALTLGVKAAKGNVILTTDADSDIQSDQWVKLMARHFIDKNIHLVLGFARPEEIKSRGRLFRLFDFTIDSADWISAACNGAPFRGDSRNMAYRRATFFEHKGFGSNIWTHYGEDDLFISEFASNSNTDVEISSGAIISMGNLQSSRKGWLSAKERHFFTAGYLHTRAYLRRALAGASLWLSTGLLIAASIIALPSLIMALASILILATIWIPLALSYRKTQSKLGTGRLAATIIPFFYTKPIFDTFCAIKFNERRKQNFTWQR